MFIGLWEWVYGYEFMKMGLLEWNCKNESMRMGFMGMSLWEWDYENGLWEWDYRNEIMGIKNINKPWISGVS